MTITGNVIKMNTELINGEIKYTLDLNGHLVDMNALIGKEISLLFMNQINCIACGKTTNKSFGQGFCFNCFQTAPEADECILHPEKCKAQFGVARDLSWSKSHCLIPHYVYLAIASGIKVGVTRHNQIPTRWIDQGAWKGIVLAETPNRHTAGIIEVFLKNHYSDKTNWRSMLKNNLENSIDIKSEKVHALSLLPQALQKYKSTDDQVLELNYPVLVYPATPKTVTFDNQSTIKGKLQGIKGQYLLFDHDIVFNVRRHNGYLMSISNE